MEKDLTITKFIESQNLPKPQPFTVSFSNMDEDVVIFKIKYGEPSDCPFGCAYEIGYGLRYKSKIGWLYLKNQENEDIPTMTYYDIESTDTYLFSELFWNDLNKADNWVYECALLPELAKDFDTPLDVLNRIAHGLYSYISPYIGEMLLLNSKVVMDRAILTILANLPFDAYSSVRDKARKLLNSF